MTKIKYSEYELQVLLEYKKKLAKKEEAVISFPAFGHSKPNWEEKQNYREPSLKEKFEKAFNNLVLKGDIYRISEDEYACAYSEKEIQQKMHEYQKPAPIKGTQSKSKAVKIEYIEKIHAPLTSSIVFNALEDDDDDLFSDDDINDLFSDDNDDEETNCSFDIVSKNMSKNESGNERPDVKTTEEAKIYIARICKTRQKAKELSLEMQHNIDGGESSYLAVMAFLRAFAEFDALSEKAYQAYRKSIVST